MSEAGLEADFSLQLGQGFQIEIALSIPPGKTAALLGPNGAGKSTAVAALAGLLPIGRGRISLGGVTLDDPARACFLPPNERKVGLLFQDHLLFPHLSVIDNVAFGLRSRGIRRPEAYRRASEWLERIGLHDLARRRPDQLSGGQSQGVALARALVIEPDLLLLDEPLSALDVTTRVQVRRTLAEHLENFAGPRLVITHDPTEAFLLADEIHIIEEGVVTQVGSADDIRLRPRTSYAADLAGSNLLVGSAAGGLVDSGGHILHIADPTISSEVILTIRPTAISVHLHPPEGSPRNAWATSVELIEALGDRVRMFTGPPLPLTVEITKEAAVSLGLLPGARIWLAIKATEIEVQAQ